MDLTAHCPVCGMIVGGDLGAGATYSYRNDRVVGICRGSSRGHSKMVTPSGLKVPVVSLSTIRFRKGSASTWTTSLIDLSRISLTRKIIDVNNAFLVHR